MRRQFRASPLVSSGALRSMSMYMRDQQSAGTHESAPRAEQDFKFVGGDQVVPGAHPLPLTNPDMERGHWPLASPYMPSPQRPHPYWTEPPAEWPTFDASVPIVYTKRCIKERIIVPVHTLTGEVSHTRELDPYIFGIYPDNDILARNAHYWMVRNKSYSTAWEHGSPEIFRKAKKSWPNTGTGLSRQSNRKQHSFTWGGRSKPMKPWNLKMPTNHPTVWHTGNRMTLALKLLQGKLQIVDRLELPEPTVDAFRGLCDTMRWDTRHNGAGVMFIDGGSRLAPSLEFNTSFFYGAFDNARCKVVRPTLQADEPYDWNKHGSTPKSKAPKGQKNPVPVNRFNTYDAMEHHLLVVTEGAVVQFEQEMHAIKAMQLPPHIRKQMPDRAMLSSPLLGQHLGPLETAEQEVAGRLEENEKAMYEEYYDNPYRPWQDEQDASYEVDATDGFIKRHTPERVGSWRRLE
jgi:ribosomal protein L4